MRADLLAVLALPEHFHEDDAIAHATALQSAVGAAIKVGQAIVAPIGINEGRALSFGAVYHPWLIGPDDGGARRPAVDATRRIRQRAHYPYDP